MTDTKIQSTAPEELAGGVNNLTSERRGNEANQTFPLSGKSGVNVEASSTAYQGKAKNDLNAGMQVSGRAQESAVPVNFKCVEGSYAGDHRADHSDKAKAALNKAADNGGPRQPMGQFANNGKTPQDSGFQAYPAECDNGD